MHSIKNINIKTKSKDMKNPEQLSQEHNPANHLVVDDEQLRNIEGHPDILELNDGSMKASEESNSEAQALELPEVQPEPAAEEAADAEGLQELSYAEKLSDPVYMMKKRQI